MSNIHPKPLVLTYAASHKVLMYIKSKLLISLQASGNIQYIFPLWDRKQLHHTYIHILDINTWPQLALAS